MVSGLVASKIRPRFSRTPQQLFLESSRFIEWKFSEELGGFLRILRARKHSDKNK